MNHYRRQLILSASPFTVYQAVATQQGLCGWWTPACESPGLTPALECFEVCHAGWKQFMASLQSLVETGRGQPFAALEPAVQA